MLNAVLESARGSLRETVASDIRFTDDHAPVEAIVDSMVIDFLLGGGIDELAD